MSPMMMIGAGAVLLVLGIGLGLWIGNIGRHKEMAKAAEVGAELDSYRRQVSEHFKKTALHFETIGVEHRRLYEHMAAGAGSLCDFRPSVFAAPVEQIGREDFDEALIGTPLRDYEAIDEMVETAEYTVTVAGPGKAELAEPEPSDEELRETESAEEFLAEHEIESDAVEKEETIH